MHSIRTVKDSINIKLQAELKEAKDDAAYWSARDDEKIAELDSIRPKALIADSLATVITALQAENVALASVSKGKAGSAGKKVEAQLKLVPLPPLQVQKP